MNITVLKLPDRLVVLRYAGRIEHTGHGPGDGYFLLQVEFHGCQKNQKQIIAASSGTVNHIAVTVAGVIIAVVYLIHDRASMFVTGWFKYNMRSISLSLYEKRMHRFTACLYFIKT